MGSIRRLALLTAVVTFLLIVVGGVVRVSGSGLGCPDWPTCHGQVVPPLVLQSVIEYSHRFVAAIASFLVVLTAVYAWLRCRHQKWVVVPATAAVVLIIIQIMLGAFTVWLELLPGMVSIHLDNALLTFATVTITAAAARWATEPGRRFHVDGYARLAIVTAVLTFVLLIVGSYVTESSAAYGCAGWPFCGNGFQPPTDAASSINLLHRLVAGLVSICFLALVVRARSSRPKEKALRGQLYGGVVILIVQVAIGAGVVLWRIPPFTAALHLAVASLFWGNLVAIAFLACFPRKEYTPPSGGQPLDVAMAVHAAPPRPVAGPSSGGRATDVAMAYLNLTKPRIIVLLLITTLGGMVIAARGFPSLSLILATMLGGAFAAGGANAINCYIDRDIDQLMHRTQTRSLPRGLVSPQNALVFGLALGALSFVVLATFANVLCAALALAGLLFYVLVYTGVLKRSTPQNIVIGGAAGAIPPMVGWVAVTGHVDLLALYLFAVIFFWTPPHFWALSLLTSQDYARANVPMLPLVVGEGETRRQIFLYSILLIAVTLLLVSSRSMGLFYLFAALALGGGLLYYAGRLLRDGSRLRARQLFMYSNIYLALLFIAMAVDRAIPAVL
ncbi:MAG TPA: heme o synthase [Chloroflexota bacterium]|nr:heme o synthase [Chloroflexota bacterium]